MLKVWFDFIVSIFTNNLWVCNNKLFVLVLKEWDLN